MKLMPLVEAGTFELFFILHFVINFFSSNLKDQSAMKMTLNQLLVEMDGFQQNNGIIVIAATNLPDALDSALIRPGRFDKVVDVPVPDIGGRKAILGLYAKKVPMDPDVDLEQIARGTPSFTGAELFNLVNQAALKASVDGLNMVSMRELEYAKDKILMGSERKSAIISPETMKMTAYHEAGHALVAIRTKGAEPIHKATIMPRGRALGMVMQLPEGDQTSMSRQQMLARLDVCMGGRVAEELIFGEDNVTSGASSDIHQATKLARAMVMKFGLSHKVGIQFIDDRQHLSPAQHDEIDNEVKRLLQEAYQRAKNVLDNNSKELHLLASGLLEYESLSGEEVVHLIDGKKIAASKRSQKPSRVSQVINTVLGKGEKEVPVVAPSIIQPTTISNNVENKATVKEDTKNSVQSQESVDKTPSEAATSQQKSSLRGPPK
jgi:ATP-dependent metalloprotease